MGYTTKPAIAISDAAISNVASISKVRVTNEKSTLFRVRNPVKLIVYPTCNPIVCAVDAYDRFRGERRVSAHPSTAISTKTAEIQDIRCYQPSVFAIGITPWVAAKKINVTKTVVMRLMLISSCDRSQRYLASHSAPIALLIAHRI